MQKVEKKDLTRPVTVKIEDFKQNLGKVVAESELPPFLLEMLIGEYLIGISQIAAQEYAEGRQEWERGKQNGEHTTGD